MATADRCRDRCVRGGWGPAFALRGSQPCTSPRAGGASQEQLRHLCGAPLPCCPLGRSGGRSRRCWGCVWGKAGGRRGRGSACRTGAGEQEGTPARGGLCAPAALTEGLAPGSDSRCASPSGLPGPRSSCAPLPPAVLPVLLGTCLSSNVRLLPMAVTPGDPALPYSSALHGSAFSEVPWRRESVSCLVGGKEQSRNINGNMAVSSRQWAQIDVPQTL